MAGSFLCRRHKALDVLCSRDDVDVDRIGCGGLSGGGLRTVFLGGLDPRIKAAVCVGFMTTWKDFLLNISELLAENIVFNTRSWHGR
jgi:cephalosporin-C deacetylase-like acetyl esterase